VIAWTSGPFAALGCSETNGIAGRRFAGRISQKSVPIDTRSSWKCRAKFRNRSAFRGPVAISAGVCGRGSIAPFCQRRVAKLFNGFAGYCCRVCVGNPPYASQTKSAQSRRHFEACKLRLRLGGNASLDAPFPERPKGMHRRTYARLKHRAEQLEAQISSLLRAKAPDYPNLVYYFDR
jgi:hypothetical protein